MFFRKIQNSRFIFVKNIKSIFNKVCIFLLFKIIILSSLNSTSTSYLNQISIKLHPQSDGNINIITTRGDRNCPNQIWDQKGNSHDDYDKCNPNLLNIDYTLYLKWDSSFQDCSYMFENKGVLTEIDLTNFDTSNVINMRNMFSNCVSLQKVILPSISCDKLQNIEEIFKGCTSLKSVEFHYNNFNTKNVNNMERMFENCNSLISINFPNNFDTSSVTKMNDMFSGCSSLTTINLNKLRTSKVNNFACLFSNTKLNYYDIMHFETNLLTDTQFMFYNCQNLISLNLSNFNWEKINNMEEMFSENGNLKLIDFGKIEIKEDVKVKNIFKNSNNKIIIYINKKNPEDLFRETNQNFIIVECGDENPENIKQNYQENKIVCVQSCRNLKNFKFKFEKRCNNECPSGTVKNITNFLCQKNLTTSPETLSSYAIPKPPIPLSTHLNIPQQIITEKAKADLLNTGNIEKPIPTNVTILCDVREFFLENCQNIFQTGEDKAKFVQNIINDILNGNLNDILSSIVKDGKLIFKQEENQKYQISTISGQKLLENLTSIDFGECEKLLKENYSLNLSEELLIFKIENIIEGINIPIIDYAVFNDNGSMALNLSLCDNLFFDYNIHVSVNSDEIYKYNLSSEYYSDLCKQYNFGDKDMTIYDRKYEYNYKNLSLCEYNCTYLRYDFNTSKVECKCPPKNDLINSDDKNNKENKQLLNTVEAEKRNINFDVTQCINLVTTKEGIITNTAFYIMLIIIVILIIVGIVFCCKSYRDLELIFDNIIETVFPEKKGKKKYRNKKNKKNPPKKTYMERMIKIKNNNRKWNNSKNKIKKSNTKNKINKKNVSASSFDTMSEDNNNSRINIYENDYEMNILSFYDALKYDKRKLKEYYCSLICRKQILIYSFLNNGDYTPGIIKKFIFFLAFALHFGVNAIFFNDDIMHQIYEDNGSYNFIYQLPYICYSLIIANAILKIILQTLIYIEKYLVAIKKQNNRLLAIHQKKKILKCIMIKYIIFFVICSAILVLFWIYLTCFSAVYKNTQIHLIKNTLISFGFTCFYPIILCIIPGIFRSDSLTTYKKETTSKIKGVRNTSKKVLLKDREYVYNISKILQIL